MRRTTPLRNKKAMRRTSGQTTRAVAMARRSKAPAVPAPDWEALRLALYTRAGGQCEACGINEGPIGWSAHHRQLRSRGGGHTLDNLTWLCGSGTTGCHGRVHAHPAAATERGFIVASWDAPETAPVRLHDGRLVLLGEDGGYVPVPTHQTPATQVAGGSEET